ncbi:DUF5602 domain-containing protein [Hymenobacter sp.]|uniref:DUF5602 domain-containing protein n=1 Tax=Hymenobacter sp. TaxID=1898978 RepID=UPI00286C00C2|nr:DUF5602 domain-containing protein [Hymenobacter sp.]
MLTSFARPLAVWSRPAALLALGLPLLLACSKTEDSAPAQPSVAYGPTVQVGGGSARGFVAADAAGKPAEIGLALTESALAGLPTAAVSPMFDVALPPSAAAGQLPFDHISLGWNPLGHDPAPTYSAPHFDVHFYLQSMAAQHTITLDDPKGDIFPAAGLLPTGYVTAPNAAPARTSPMMGRHWVDPTSPEYAPGGTFTHTFVYGTYDGHVTFLEPMLTKAMLVPAVGVEQAIKQPAAHEATGKYYPTKYTIRHDAGTHEYLITMKDMVLR